MIWSRGNAAWQRDSDEDLLTDIPVNRTIVAVVEGDMSLVSRRTFIRSDQQGSRGYSPSLGVRR